MLARLVCRLFGHAALTNAGWCHGVGYARVDHSTIDGLGTLHLHVTAECPRCGVRYDSCKLHAQEFK